MTVAHLTVDAELNPRDWWLRPLDGWDELWFAEQRSTAGWRVAERLVSPDARPAGIDELPVGAVESLLVGLYVELYGPSAECVVECECGETSEIEVDVVELHERVSPEGGAWATAPIVTESGRTLRMPVVGDMRAAADAAELLGRLTEGPTDGDTTEVDEALRSGCGVIDLVLTSSCPECGGPLRVQFVLAEFLRRRIADELPLLHREVHVLASAYGWPRDEIMSLPRGTRQTHAGLVLNDRGARRR